ncbi:MAG: hypothetical protein WAU96_12855 [Anaerolineae bacterium]
MAALVFGSTEAQAALEKDRRALKVKTVLDEVDSDKWSDYEELKGRLRHLEDQLAETENDLLQIESDWKGKGLSVDEVVEIMKATAKDGK